MQGRPPLLFLHGAFGGAEIWRRFVAPFFAARGHAVATPALPGPGAPRSARLRDYVAAARVAADSLGGAPVVIGHSFGGLVAQHLAAERRLPGLVLAAAPGPAGLSPALWRLSGKRDVLAALMLAQAGLGHTLGPQAARAALFTEETPDDWILEHAPPPLAESLLALADGLLWDLPAWPMVWGTPVLAIAADRDAFIPMTDLAALQWSYGADIAVMRDMAHGMPIDPRWKRVAWRIGVWLEERRIGQNRAMAVR